MLHRLILTFSLIVSFGIAQIGAFTHEISHYAEASAQNQQQDFNKNPNKNSQTDQAPHNQVCEKCVSYAELGNAISSAHVALPLVVTSNLQISTHLTTHSQAKLNSYNARASPIRA